MARFDIQELPVKMKVGRLIDAQFGASFSKILKSTTVPAWVSFKIRGIRRAVDAEVGKYNEVKDTYIGEYAERDEAGKVKLEDLPSGAKGVILEGARAEECKRKLRELQDVEAEIPSLPIAALDDATVAMLTPEDYCWLEFIEEN